MKWSLRSIQESLAPSVNEIAESFEAVSLKSSNPKGGLQLQQSSSSHVDDLSPTASLLCVLKGSPVKGFVKIALDIQLHLTGFIHKANTDKEREKLQWKGNRKALFYFKMHVFTATAERNMIGLIYKKG